MAAVDRNVLRLATMNSSRPRTTLRRSRHQRSDRAGPAVRLDGFSRVRERRPRTKPNRIRRTRITEGGLKNPPGSPPSSPCLRSAIRKPKSAVEDAGPAALHPPVPATCPPGDSGRADLHLHTTPSDGAYTPAQIVDIARAAWPRSRLRTTTRRASWRHGPPRGHDSK